MKRLLVILLCSQVLFFSCLDSKNSEKINAVDWEERQINMSETDSLKLGQSYLSVYSEIYSITEHRTINLTVTVSLRNVSTIQEAYLLSANYYSTSGKLLRTYFNKPIALKPLETLEIIIDENDKHGGSGANFVFDWAVKEENNHEPHFEAVMISTSGQQGISFLTQGIKL